MKKKQKNLFKIYELDGFKFYKYNKPNKFLYNIEVYKYTNSLYELISNDIIESDKFLNLQSVVYKKCKNILYSKDVTLIAAPIEFINQNININKNE